MKYMLALLLAVGSFTPVIAQNQGAEQQAPQSPAPCTGPRDAAILAITKVADMALDIGTAGTLNALGAATDITCRAVAPGTPQMDTNCENLGSTVSNPAEAAARAALGCPWDWKD